MSAQSARHPARDPREPAVHLLDPIRFDGDVVEIRLLVRADDDGVWRGRLMFAGPEGGGERTTAEILCGASEQELWDSVRGLRDHHLRDLYRSLG